MEELRNEVKILKEHLFVLQEHMQLNAEKIKRLENGQAHSPQVTRLDLKILKEKIPFKYGLEYTIFVSEWKTQKV